MTPQSWLQTLIYFVALVLVSMPLGAYIARVFEDRASVMSKLIGPLERTVYKAAGVSAQDEMTWSQYAIAVLIFNALGTLVVYALCRTQAWLPLNPEHQAAMTPEVAFNTAVSFASNTNWQAYGGETALGYLTQMLALTTQNFVSAATGIAVLVALVRGITRREAQHVGNFWVDLTRSTLYLLLPLSALVALALVACGVVQTLSPYLVTTPLDASASAHQTLALGPAASQIAIKQLGTNGGGFFNANSAHPFENPNALSNFIEMLSILLIPAALCFAFGAMVKDKRQGVMLLAVMLAVLVPATLFVISQEQSGSPMLASLGVDMQASAHAPGGNMEGKEARFGIVNSAIWSAVTTAASSGSVNSMHDSFTPLGGLVPMVLMQLGEIIFGGVGSGLYGLLVYAIIAVFIAGLMVGRTPEYLGKKIEAYEMKMASLVVLIPAAAVLIGTAIASAADAGTSTLGNPGPHGFSEILYAFSSGANNNGSAFGGVTVSGTFYATAIGIAMLLGRYWVIIAVLAIAGSLARKKIVPPSPGTLPTHTPLFVALLTGTIVLVGALTFVPALALGPIVEHLQLHARQQ